MEAFPNDALNADFCHGDIMLQICANKSDTVLHALRAIIKAAPDMLAVRWTLDGSLPIDPPGVPRRSRMQTTPRNLLGFKDGTANIDRNDAGLMNRQVWVTPGANEPAWTVGGSYQVVRIIRQFVERWDRTPLQEQQTIIGREKAGGAPLGRAKEHDDPAYAADPKGDRIPLDAWPIRLSPIRARTETASSLILRRGYNYSRGVTQAGQLDMGLLFVCYQASLQSGFLAVQNRLNGEPLEEYIKPVGGGYFFALPGVTSTSGYLGERLFGPESLTHQPLLNRLVSLPTRRRSSQAPRTVVMNKKTSILLAAGPVWRYLPPPPFSSAGGDPAGRFRRADIRMQDLLFGRSRRDRGFDEDLRRCSEGERPDQGAVALCRDARPLREDRAGRRSLQRSRQEHRLARRRLRQEGSRSGPSSGLPPHRIRPLFQEVDEDGHAPVADKLLADVQDLQKRITDLVLPPAKVVGGAADLIEEISKTKISGEEDRYSRTDLWDFKANLDGAQKIVALLQPLTTKANPKLQTRIDANFAKVDGILAKYAVGDGYQSYDAISKKDRTALRGPVTALAEDLSKLRGTLGLK